VAQSYKDEIYRKTIHLSSLWMVAAIYFLSKENALYLFSFLLVGMTAFEIARRYWPFFTRINILLMGRILRPHENNGDKSQMTGAFYVILAVFLAVLLFSKPVCMTAISIMLVADSAAALIGRKFGRHKIFDKSIEGSAAFFLTALMIIVIGMSLGLTLPFYGAVIVAIIATLLELFSKKIHLDDNISIVMGAGLALTILQIF